MTAQSLLYGMLRHLTSPKLWVITLAALLVYWILWIIYTRTLHPLANIRGPYLASISRLWILQRLRSGNMDHAQRQLHAKYGYLVRIAPNEIACSQPNAIRTIYPMQNPLTKTDFYPVWGNSTFSKHPDNFSGTDEKVHSSRRRIVNHVYSLSNVLKSEQYIDKCSSVFMKRLGEFADAGSIFDLGHWLQMYAFDAIGELYFGRQFGFIEKSTDHGDYIKSLDTLMPVLCATAVAPSYSRAFILGTAILSSKVRAALKSIDLIAAAARGCVTERLRELADPEASVRLRTDLLQQLLDISEDKGDKVDFGKGEVQLEAYVALFAGSDTTAIAMRAVLYYLHRNPDVHKELMHELTSAYESGSLSIPVKYAEASQLRFLCACIKEAMRLHPSVGFTMPRIVPKGGMTLDGHFIPAGYRIGMNAAVVHYDTDIFGSDAKEYRPSRWLEGEATTMDKYMLQFGAGTRTCIGKNISLAELHKLIPQLLLSFEIDFVSDQPWKTTNLWFNKPTGLEARVKRRNLPDLRPGQ